MKNWLIVCPTNIEFVSTVAIFGNVFGNIEESNTIRNGRKVSYNDNTFYIMKSGIGRTLSSITVSSVLSTVKDIDYVIVLGTCGSAIENSLGKTYCIDNPTYGDFNTFDVVNKMGIADSDSSLLSKLESPTTLISKLYDIGIDVAPCVSVDHIVDYKERGTYKDCLFDMESACIATVCRYYSKPFLAIRTVTDVDSFEEYLPNAKMAAIKSAEAFCNAIRDKITDDTIRLRAKHYKDFPKKGVDFIDIGSIINNSTYFNYVLNKMIDLIPAKTTRLIAVDSRGFIFGSALAAKLNLPLVMARKSGKLPGDLISCTYEKEYGKDSLFVQKSMLNKDDKLVIIDDLAFTCNTVMSLRDALIDSGYDVIDIIVAGILNNLTEPQTYIISWAIDFT